MTETPAIRKCVQSLCSLGFRYPHFLMVHARLKHLYREDTSIGTMQIEENGAITINPNFVNALDKATLGGCIAHEMLHLSLGYWARMGAKIPQLWNFAHDMAINSALRRDGISLPRGALYPPTEYNGPLYAEPIYEWLLEQAKEQEKEQDACQGSGQGKGAPGMPGQGQGQGQGVPPKVTQGCGVQKSKGQGQGQGQGQGSNPSEGPGSGQSINFEAVWESARQLSEQRARGIGQGTTSAVLDLINPRPSRTDWRKIIGHGFQLVSQRPDKASQTFSRRHRRSPISGPQLPGWVSGDPRIAILIDTSGSMGREWVSDIVSHVLKVGATYPRTKIFLATHTDSLCWSGWVTGASKDAIVASVQKSGGTDARPAYEAARKAGHFDALIHFTDCELPGKWPDYAARRLIVGAYGPGADSPYCALPPGAVLIPCIRER